MSFHLLLRSYSPLVIQISICLESFEKGCTDVWPKLAWHVQSKNTWVQLESTVTELKYSISTELDLFIFDRAVTKSL